MVYLVISILQLLRLMPELMVFKSKGEIPFYSNPKDGCINIIHNEWNIFGISCNLPDNCGQKLRIDRLSGNFWSKFVLCQKYKLPMVHPSWDVKFSLETKIFFPGFVNVTFPSADDMKLMKHQLFHVGKQYWLSNPFSNQNMESRYGVIDKSVVLKCGKYSNSALWSNRSISTKIPSMFSYTKMPEKYIFWRKFLVPDLNDENIIKSYIQQPNETFITEKLNYPFKMHVEVYSTVQEATQIKNYPYGVAYLSNCFKADSIFTVGNDNFTIYMGLGLKSRIKSDTLYVTCTKFVCSMKRKQIRWPYKHFLLDNFIRPDIFHITRRGAVLKFENYLLNSKTLMITATTLTPRSSMKSSYGYITLNEPGIPLIFNMTNKDLVCGIHKIDKNIPYGPMLINDDKTYYEDGKLIKFLKSYECNTPIPVVVHTTLSQLVGIYQKWVLSAFMTIVNELMSAFEDIFNEELWDIEIILKWLFKIIIKFINVITKTLMEILDELGLLTVVILETFPLFSFFYIATQNYYMATILTLIVIFALYVIRM